MLLDDPLDPRVREYAHLRAATLRLRAEGPDGARDGVFIAEGELVIERALRARLSHALAAAAGAAAGALRPSRARGRARVRGDRRADALDHRIRGAPRRARLVRPQAAARASASSCARARRVVVLEDVNNHTNVGAIVRSASALGIDALLLDPGSCDPLYRRSLRISMGEALSLPHARTEALPGGLAPLREAGFVLAALTPAPDARSTSRPSPQPVTSGWRCCWAPRARGSRRPCWQRPTCGCASRWPPASTRSTSRPPQRSRSTRSQRDARGLTLDVPLAVDAHAGARHARPARDAGYS